MKVQNERPDLSDMPPYRLGRHWNTIQAYLIPGIEDDLGELSKELKKFVEICELLIDEKMFAKYRWCGNGRPPSSRISMFKAYILKAMRNYPYTKTLIAAVRESPTIRRLCGWESVADIPDKSQFSRTFKAFAKDDVGSKALAACLAENLGRNGVMHGSHDSSEIEAREKGVTRKRDAKCHMGSDPVAVPKKADRPFERSAFFGCLPAFLRPSRLRADAPGGSAPAGPPVEIVLELVVHG